MSHGQAALGPLWPGLGLGAGSQNLAGTWFCEYSILIQIPLEGIGGTPRLPRVPSEGGLLLAGVLSFRKKETFLCVLP